MGRAERLPDKAQLEVVALPPETAIWHEFEAGRLVLADVVELGLERVHVLAVFHLGQVPHEGWEVQANPQVLLKPLLLQVQQARHHDLVDLCLGQEVLPLVADEKVIVIEAVPQLLLDLIVVLLEDGQLVSDLRSHSHLLDLLCYRVVHVARRVQIEVDPIGQANLAWVLLITCACGLALRQRQFLGQELLNFLSTITEGILAVHLLEWLL